MSLTIPKRRDRFCCGAFLRFVRSKPCCACKLKGVFRASTASHMKSIKFADGSDGLAVNACIPLHHVASTRTSRELLERAGIVLAKLHEELWREFLELQGIPVPELITQAVFEALCENAGLRDKPRTTRKDKFAKLLL